MPAFQKPFNVGIVLAGLFVCLTISGLVKPILWDEAVYLQFASHIAQHPFDPYGAPIWLAGRVQQGLFVLAPPVVLYAWAAALKVFNGDLTLSGLFLAPFAALYVVSFYALAVRFAPRVALPFTILSALSAWSLVTFSYMLDFPAVALGLAALALFVRGTDRGAVGLAICAGLVAGVALETKYNAAAICGAIALYAILARRIMLGVCVVALAVSVAAACELLIFAKYGQSHFLIHLHANGDRGLSGEISRLRDLFYALIANDGPTAIGLLGATTLALRARPAEFAIVVAVALTAFGLAALGFDRILAIPLFGIDASALPTLLTLSGLLGLAVIIQYARMLNQRRPEILQNRDLLFLLGWIIVEAIVYFAMSPFPAARRMGELQAALALSIAAFLNSNPTVSIKRSYVCAALGAGSGTIMLAVALFDGWSVVKTAQAAAALVKDNAKRYWQLTSIVNDIHLTRLGVARLQTGRTVLEAGDRLVLDDGSEKSFGLDLSGLQDVDVVPESQPLPVRVSTEFYRWKLPWTPTSDRRSSLIVLRATRSTMPLK